MWSISLMLLASYQVRPQNQNLYFDNYTSHDGLSQNSCYAISQDDKGFMWFATQDGLNRYDGKEFQIYLPGKENGKELPSNHVSSLLFDSDEGIMWIGTVRGICLYQQGIDSIISVSDPYPFAAELKNLPVKEIVRFEKGKYWIISQNKGLVFVDLEKGKIQTLFDKPGIRSQVNSVVEHNGTIVTAVGEKLYTLSADRDSLSSELLKAQSDFSEIKKLYSYRDQLWVGTFTKGCFVIEDVGGQNRVKNFKLAETGGIGTFIEDESGDLWIGTRGNGIVVFDPEKNQIRQAKYNKYDDRSPGKNFILSLFRDRQNIMWCGLSGGGISKYDPLKYQFTNLNNDPLNPRSLPGNMVFEVYKGKDDGYYVGTQNKGFVRWDFHSGTFHEYPYFSSPGVPENTVYDILEVGSNSIWIASWGGLIHFNKTSQRFEKYGNDLYPAVRNLYALHKLKNADSLLVTGENGAMFFDLGEKKWSPCLPDFFAKKNYIGRHILEGENNVVWICTEGAGLVRVDYKKKDFEIISKIAEISENSRYVLKEGPDFWVATDNGIVVYNYEQDKIIRHISFDDINNSNVCYSIQKDPMGNFWVGTNFGLVRINSEDYSLRVYNLGNGLRFPEYNTACVMSDTGGSMVFGGVGGITLFKPQELKDNTFSPDPIITSVRVNEASIPFIGTDNFVFPHSENQLTFEFTANNFSNQERNQYVYRMVGLSDQWTDNKNSHFVSFNSVPPGSYTFQVKSANSDGLWSANTTDFSFVIYPPWWKSWWFLSLLILSVIFFSMVLVRRRIMHIRKKAELRQKIFETEMMALRAQMNPHFIFNCLNSIDAFIQSNDKYQATTYLNKFAKLLRNVLDSSKQNTVTFSKDFETLKLYLELEELRNENKFTTEMHADSVLLQDDFKVPPLLVQPYVENAIIHGLKYKSDNNGVLKISVKKLSDKIQYIIEDNGVGRNGNSNSISKDKTSYGMQMSSDRVKYFNGEQEASVIITDLTEGGEASGTRIEVLLDLR